MEISFMEMLVIGIIAFVVLGPEELAKRAHQLGRFIAKLRTEMNNLKIMTNEELMKHSDSKTLDEVRKTLATPIQLGKDATTKEAEKNNPV